MTQPPIILKLGPRSYVALRCHSIVGDGPSQAGVYELTRDDPRYRNYLDLRAPGIDRSGEEEGQMKTKQALDAGRRHFWNRPTCHPSHGNAVLLSRPDEDFPVWPGFYEHGQWHLAGGESCDDVIGWMELKMAARILSDV